MAKIPVPKRRITPTGKAGVERMPAYPQPSRRIGYETQRLGQTLRNLGGTFSQLATNLQELQHDNDILTGKNLLAQDYKTYVDTEVSKDDDYAGREGKFYLWFDNMTKEHLISLKSERAKRDLKKWHTGERLRMGIQVATQGQRLLIQDTQLKSETYLASLEQAWANAATEEDKERIEDEAEEHFKKLDADNIYVDGWIEQREIDFLLNAKELAYNKLKENAYVSAYGILLTTGNVEAAISHLLDRENFAGLKVGDRHAMIRRIQADNLFGQYEDSKRMTKEDAALVDEITNLYLGADSKAFSDFIHAMPEGMTKDTWIKIKEAESHLTGEEKTSYKKVYYSKDKLKGETKGDAEGRVLIEDEIFNYWADRTDERRKNLKNRLARARSIGALSRRDYFTLLSRMDIKLEPHQIGRIRAGFDAVKDQAYTGWFDLTINADEARSIAVARTELLDWIISGIARKKEPSLEDILKAALGFYSIAPARGLKGSPELPLETYKKLLEEQGRILIRGPRGRLGSVPKEQRDLAVKEGYEVLE